MSNKKAETNAPIRDDVDRATDRIRRAADQLVQLMSKPHGDWPIDQRTARSLLALGEYAVEPLAAGLKKASGLAHRSLIVALIQQIATRTTLELLEILDKIARKDPEEKMRELASTAISMIATREMEAMVRAG